MGTFVIAKVRTLAECLAAVIACICLLTCVHAFMVPQVGPLAEGLQTECTTKWLLSSMRTLMVVKVVTLGECFVAQLAPVRFLA